MNILLNNNPVFLGGHFVRVFPLEVIGLCGFRCGTGYPRVICRICHLCFQLPLAIFSAHLQCKICSKLSKYYLWRGKV